MKQKTLKAHAKFNNVFQDPEENNVFYLTNTETNNGYNSHFLIPSKSRYIYIPLQVQQTLEDHGANFEKGAVKQYPKYRSIWGICPKCLGEETCSSMLFDNTDVYAGHCINEEQYIFGLCEEQEYKDSNIIFYNYDNPVGDDND